MGSVLSHRMELLKSRPLQGCIIYYIAAEPQNLLYSSGPTESIFNEGFPLQVQRIGLRIDTGLFWSHLADPSTLGKGKCHSPIDFFDFWPHSWIFFSIKKFLL